MAIYLVRLRKSPELNAVASALGGFRRPKRWLVGCFGITTDISLTGRRASSWSSSIVRSTCISRFDLAIQFKDYLFAVLRWRTSGRGSSSSVVSERALTTKPLLIAKIRKILFILQTRFDTLWDMVVAEGRLQGSHLDFTSERAALARMLTQGRHGRKSRSNRFPNCENSMFPAPTERAKTGKRRRFTIERIVGTPSRMRPASPARTLRCRRKVELEPTLMQWARQPRPHCPLPQ